MRNDWGYGRAGVGSSLGWTSRWSACASGVLIPTGLELGQTVVRLTKVGGDVLLARALNGISSWGIG